MKRPEYIDCHTHVNFAAFDEDREEVIAKTLENNTWMINVGTQKDTSQSAVELANQHERGVYAIVGIHPIHTGKSFHDVDELGSSGGDTNGFNSRGEEFDSDFYKNLAQNEKVVGIGETGLDYFRLEKGSREKQQEIFIKHIELANSVNKPLMLHIRPSREDTDSYRDALKILKEHAKVPGDAHFFAGSVEDAKKFLDIGYLVSFTGVITFTSDYDEVIRYMPLESILSETDAPYVAPVPHRGKRNEPIFVQEVVKKIAEIKDLPLEKVKEQMVENAFRFFSFS